MKSYWKGTLYVEGQALPSLGGGEPHSADNPPQKKSKQNPVFLLLPYITHS